MERVVLWSSKCAVIGVWLGAIVIPLDWDRPWQAWPIPCAVGTLVGYVFGLLLAALEMCAMSLEDKMKEN